MARTKLKLVDAGRSPEREALAVAIAALTKVERNVQRRLAAVERARQLVEDAEDRLAEARDVVQQAKSSQAKRLMKATAKPAKPLDAGGTREARLAEADAEDAFAAAQTALGDCEADVPDFERYGPCKEREAVDASALAVIRASGWPARLLAEAHAAHDEAMRTRAALRFFHDLGFPIHDAPSMFPDDVKAEALTLLHRGWEFSHESLWKKQPAVDLWKAALEALKQDPGAPLPG